MSREIAAAGVNESLTETEAESVKALRASGLTFTEISMITGIPRAECYQVVCGPQWPKLVTRIGADGTATLVRFA